MIYKELCTDVPQNCVWNCHGVFTIHKNYISENVCEHSDFPTNAETVYSGRTAINWVLKSKNRRKGIRFENQ